MFLSTAHAVADRNAAPLLLRRETVIGVPAAVLCALAAILVASRAHRQRGSVSMRRRALQVPARRSTARLDGVTS
jgi:hypothetical protein